MRHRRLRRAGAPSRSSSSPACTSSSTAATTRPGSPSSSGDAIESVRAVGNLEHLREAVRARADAAGGTAVAVAERPATTGIGHTRWATHGRVNEENAHPHFDTTDRVHVVVNGIVENYLALKRAPRRPGRRLHVARPTPRSSPTSSPTTWPPATLAEAVPRRLRRARGPLRLRRHVASTSPTLLVGARKECPLVVGRGDGETFLASADPGLPAPRRAASSSSRTARSSRSRPDGATFLHARRRPSSSARSTEVDWDEETAEKGGYETLHAQGDPRAGRRGRRDDRRPHRPRGRRRPRRRGALRRGAAARRQAHRRRRLRHELPRGPDRPLRDRGVGARARSRWTSPPSTATATRSSGPGDLVIGITQSGETADTLAAMRIARERGATRARHHEHHGLAGHARRRRRAVHARRARGLRRRDEDVRLPGRGHVPARACASPSCAARSTAERRTQLVARAQAHPALHRGAARAGSTPRSSAIAERALGRGASSSTSAATSACRSRSRAR